MSVIFLCKEELDNLKVAYKPEYGLINETFGYQFSERICRDNMYYELIYEQNIEFGVWRIYQISRGSMFTSILRLRLRLKTKTTPADIIRFKTKEDAIKVVDYIHDRMKLEAL